jgi:hypothetical protein
MEACPNEVSLAAYVEDTLDPDTRDQVERHASGCVTCSQRIGSTLGGTVEESAGPTPPLKQVGRYALVRVVGAGGMGSVYEAHDTELDRRVAVKLLRARWSDEDPLSERIRREAKAMAKLAHPNVVAVYDVEVADRQAYLVMELVDGIPLSTWLAKPRPWKQVLNAFVQAGRGVAAVHAAGIVHSDFKPQNVLIAPNGRVCVTDFGIAAPAQDGRNRGIAGTPGYMAPEQMSPGPIDARADVFAFCVALFEALYDTRPFTGKTLEELRTRILAQEVNAPVRRAAPSWIRPVLLRGLRAAPEERYPAMGPLLDALDAASRARSRIIIGGASVVVAACAAAALWRVEARRPAIEALPAEAPIASATAPSPPSSVQGAPSSLEGAPSSVTAATTGATTAATTSGPIVTTAGGAAATGSVGAAAAQVSTGNTSRRIQPVPSTTRGQSASSRPCQLVKTMDKAGETHFSCPCATCE